MGLLRRIPVPHVTGNDGHSALIPSQLYCHILFFCFMCLCVCVCVCFVLFFLERERERERESEQKRDEERGRKTERRDFLNNANTKNIVSVG